MPVMAQKLSFVVMLIAFDGVPLTLLVDLRTLPCSL